MTRNWFQEWLMVGAPPGFGPPSALRRFGDDPTLPTDTDAPRTLPTDLQGATVLHVGCDAGALCLEALRSGASRVLGVDRDPERVSLARGYASLAGLPAEFQVLEPDQQLPGGRFQVVVCTDVGSYRDPVALIDRLGRMTDETLILEWEGPSSAAARAYMDRVGAPRAPDDFDRWPAVLVADDGDVRARSYLTTTAVQRLLQAQSARFSRVRISKIGQTGRYRAVATRRVISRLVVVAAAGRSEAAWVVGRIQAGRVPNRLLDRIGLDDPSLWQFAPNGNVEPSNGLVTPGLVFGYDLHGAWRERAGRFGFDELADLIDSAIEVQVITCWAEPRVLQQRGRVRVGRSSLNLRRLERQRLRELMSTLRGLTRRAVTAPPSRWTPARFRRFVRRARRELDMDRRALSERARMEARLADERAYRRTDEHLLRYARWLDYCHGADADGHWILDTSSDEWNVESADRWGHLLIERAKRRSDHPA